MLSRGDGTVMPHLNLLREVAVDSWECRRCEEGLREQVEEAVLQADGFALVAVSPICRMSRRTRFTFTR